MTVGIHGFGRIGKLVLRACLERGIDVQVINASRTEEELAYLAKYDSVHGRMAIDVIPGDGYVTFGDKQVMLTRYREVSAIPWAAIGVDIVVDCTGKNTTMATASQHLVGGAKKVLISSPEKDPSIPMFVYGVNTDKFTSDLLVVSGASCTTNCLAPMAKVVNDNFGIDSGLLTTVHAVTNSQNAVDGHGKKDPRLGRSLFNIIPASTGAAKALTKVIPELKGKVTGMAFRVPTQDVSVVDFSVNLKRDASYAEICQAMKDASEGQFKGIIEFVDEPVVSADFIHSPFTCEFDASAGLMLEEHRMAKLVAWYDNEGGYVTQLVSLLEMMLA